MRTKNKTLAIGGIEPPISSIFIDRTQRPRQTKVVDKHATGTR